jgi:hypothetical protein
VNRTDAVKLARMIRALCPSQKLDEHTPDAWAIVLDDVRYEDAVAAVRIYYRERGNDEEWGGRRIEADDILREVKRLRNDRIVRFGDIAPPPGMSELEQRTWLRESRRLIADGHPEQVQIAPPGERKLALTVGRTVDGAA